MATVTFIRNTKQGAGALHGVSKYVSQGKKTNNGLLISGQNCSPQFAAREFIATRQMHRKDSPVYFYQYVQSFSPEENISAALAHEVAKEFAARAWPESEVLIATHVDAEHIHTHFVVNAVCFETGMMLRQEPNTLSKLRAISDELCAAHGLSVLPKQTKQTQNMSAREYRAAAKGESWKLRLMATIDECMTYARTKDEFIALMCSEGYEVKWEPSRKSITYTCPDGQKCRDDRLHDKKYLKEAMEREFQIREAILYGRIEKAEYVDRAISPTDTTLPHSGAMGRTADPTQHSVPHGSSTEPPTGTDAVNPDYLRYERAGGGDDKAALHDADEHRTGWEAEREALFSAPAQTQTSAYQAQPRPASHPSHPAGVLGDVVELGYAVECNQTNPSDAPVMRHGDHRALAKERVKKIALGHKPDDHEDENTYEQKMY